MAFSTNSDTGQQVFGTSAGTTTTRSVLQGQINSLAQRVADLEEEVGAISTAVWTFADLQTAITNEQALVEFYAHITPTAAITIPVGMHIDFRGFTLVDGGYSVTFYGTTNMDRGQKFSGFTAGDIKGTFGHGIIYPEWWGLAGSDINDGQHDLAINAAIQAIPISTLGVGCTVLLGAGFYYVSAPLDLSDKYGTLEGAGPKQTEIWATTAWTATWKDTALWASVSGGNHAAMVYIGGSIPGANTYACKVKNLLLRVKNAAVANPTRHISGISSHHGVEENCEIDDVIVTWASGCHIGFPDHYYTPSLAYVSTVINGLRVGKVWLTGTIIRSAYAVYIPDNTGNCTFQDLSIDVRLPLVDVGTFDWMEVAIRAAGKVRFGMVHIEGTVIGIHIPQTVVAGSGVSVESLDVNHMMNAAAVPAYDADTTVSVISGVATYSAGTETLLTVDTSTGTVAGQVILISGAAGTNAASYNGVHIVTAVPDATHIAINKTWQAEGASPTNAGNITWNAAPVTFPTISNSATHAAGAETLLTVSDTRGMAADQPVNIYKANGANAADYNTVHTVTEVVSSTQVAIDLAWPGAATTTGQIAHPNVLHNIDFDGYSTAILIGSLTDGYNYTSRVNLGVVRSYGQCSYLLRDRVFGHHISAFGWGQFGYVGASSIADYARGNGYKNAPGAPYAFLSGFRRNDPAGADQIHTDRTYYTGPVY
jgi:hypothetical protein